MTDTYALAGKTAIVTGGGKGLGKTLARFLLEAGMNVAICGRTETAVKQTVKQFDVLFPGNIIVRQRGTKIHPGDSVGMGKDHSIFSKIKGTVVFKKGKSDRTFVSVKPN